VIPLRDDNPVERFPIVTYALLASNLLAFAWQLGLPGVLSEPALLSAMRTHLAASVAWGSLVPYDLLTLGEQPGRPPAILTVLTSVFLHGGWFHVGFNMLFLWIFGNNIEDRVGRRRFLLFYLLGGLAAAGLQLAVGPSSDVPNIGASGAIAAVLGGYLLLYPTAAVITYIPPFFVLPLPAIFFLAGWFALQILAASAVQVGSSGGGVAYFAHIGGFAFGVLTIRWWVRRNEPRPPAYA
jgi:membrane associated rhomboid family serine protease